MSVKYLYGVANYATKAEAETAKAAQEIRFQNNPTDWMTVKQITGSQESGWVVNPTPLTDSEILNLDDSKFYLVYSPVNGENLMPLTSSEVTEKVTEYKNVYKDHNFYNSILEIPILDGNDSMTPKES